jgi:hypothetical protein
MRNRLFVALLLLVAGAGLLWSQFYDDYSAAERKSLGESYWLAGRQYEAVGKIEKGREFQQLARIIYPGLDPEAISESDQPSAAELLAAGRARPLGAGAETSSTQALNSFFLRFVGAMLDEDAAAVSEFLDGAVYLSALPGEVDREEMRGQLASLFDQVSLAGYTPDTVYDLDTVVVARAPQALAAVAGESWTLRVEAKADFSAALGFWEQKQQFFVRRAPAGLAIFAIGSEAPPAAWRPRSAQPPAASSVEPAPLTDSQASAAIRDAFTGCLAAFLRKNADGALAFMADDVTFLRLRQSVTKDELRLSFQGYFESTDFGEAEVGDIIDTASLFVEPAESPVSGVGPKAYRLNAEAKVDLSATIPFLGKYQRYYFVQDGGDWKIFAIL